MSEVADSKVVYETKTVRAIRGTEARTVAKWEKDGWEVVSSDTGKLQTVITIRRPKPTSRVLLYVAAASALVLILGTVITVGAINENNAAPAASTPSAVPTEESEDTSAAPEPSPTSPPAAKPVAITAENTPEFAALLSLTDYCDPSIGAFAEKYRGQGVAFDGNVSALAQHENATTRFDILLGAGDFDENSQPGPAFQFRDVNTTNDLHYTGPIPDAIAPGQNLRVNAELGEYEATSCLLLLEPTETSFR